MSKVRFSLFLTVLMIFCGTAFVAAGQATGPANTPPKVEVSGAATQGDAFHNAVGGNAANRALPPDHWLNGTSKAPDMVAAVVAPAAPRRLIAEHGPAYLEQIGTTRVLHLKGSYYDMGLQHGALMKDEIKVAAKLIETVGTFSWSSNFKASTREAWNRTSPFIPQKFKDEIAGMAAGTGLSVEEVEDFTIFPELFHCSGFAVWGKATADGKLLHGRVLDYMRDLGFDRWALVIIEEPESANAFVNVGYSGTIGSVTGMNMNHVAIGEMGGGGKEKWDGMPMTLLVRDCLERANTVEDARKIMTDTPRTCEYYYVISDSKAKDGRGDAYGVAAYPEKIEFIGAGESHPLLLRPQKDTVMLSAGERYNCLASRVEKMYGKITPQVGLDLMARGVAMSSNMHDALFKPETLEVWVANCTPVTPACNMPYNHYDLQKLMIEKPGS